MLHPEKARTRQRVTIGPLMLIPLGTDRPLRRPTLVTPVLLAVNVAVFAVQMVAKARSPDEYWAWTRPWVLNPWGRGLEWYQPLTSAFMHADGWHLAGNMLFLWVFGQNIEDRLGRWWFVLFYVCAAYAAGGAHVAFESSSALGASGAVAGLTGAYLVLFPRTNVRVIFLLFLSVFWVSAWWVIGLAVVWDLMMSGLGARTGVAHLAHLGGVAFGVSVSMVLLWAKWLPREPYDLFTMGKQAYRRRQFKEAGLARERTVRKHWERAQKKVGGETARESQAGEADEIEAMRAEVVRLLGMPEQSRQVVEAYRKLIGRHGDKPAAVTLSFKQHEQLAIVLYSSVDKQTAAFAIERLIEAYPKESSTPRFMLLLGLLNARELNDPVRAKALLLAARERVGDEGERALAEQALADLG